MDKDWDIRPGLESRQSRDLPVDGKKLVIRGPIKSEYKELGQKKMSFCKRVVHNLRVQNKIGKKTSCSQAFKNNKSRNLVEESKQNIRRKIKSFQKSFCLIQTVTYIDRVRLNYQT